MEKVSARRFLEELLAAGPKAAGDVLEIAGKAGYHKRTVQRAADSLGVIRKREWLEGFWIWRLGHGGGCTRNAPPVPKKSIGTGGRG